jgi:hypothetical protein
MRIYFHSQHIVEDEPEVTGCGTGEDEFEVNAGWRGAAWEGRG